MPRRVVSSEPALVTKMPSPREPVMTLFSISDWASCDTNTLVSQAFTVLLRKVMPRIGVAVDAPRAV